MAKIRDYRFGYVVVEGQQETRDLIVLPRRVVRNWWRRDGHALVLEDLADVLEELYSSDGGPQGARGGG